MTTSDTSSDTGRTCEHGDDRLAGDRLAEELRAVALLALDRLDPLLARLRDALQPAATPESGGTPGPCPLCVARAALRDVLATPAPAEAPRAARPVQHIQVDRAPRAPRC